jgi:hypothetical protein
MSSTGAIPDPFASDTEDTMDSMSSGSGDFESKTPVSSNQENVLQNVQGLGPPIASNSANGSSASVNLSGTTDSQVVLPKATQTSSVGNSLFEFQVSGGPALSNSASVSTNGKSAFLNAPTDFKNHSVAKKLNFSAVGAVPAAVEGNSVSPLVAPFIFSSLDEKEPYMKARDWLDDRCFGIPLDDLDVSPSTKGTFFYESSSGKATPVKVKQRDAAKIALQKLLPNFALPALTVDTHFQKQNGNYKERFVFCFATSQECVAVQEEIYRVKNKHYSFYKPLMLSVECDAFGIEASLNEIADSLKGQLEYYGLRGVTAHGIIKCKKAIQFSVPSHLIGHLHFLSPPNQPTVQTKWFKLAPRNPANLWCKWCQNHGHSEAKCSAKAANQRKLCDTCGVGCCEVNACVKFRPGEPWMECQSKLCPVPQGKRNHRTSQCVSVMSTRVPISDSPQFRFDSMAKIRGCRYGLQAGATVHMGSSGQSYANAAASSQPAASHLSSQPPQPSQNHASPNQDPLALALITTRLNKTEAKYQDLVNQNQRLQDQILELAAELTSQASTIKKLCDRGGKEREKQDVSQRKRKIESRRSRSGSPQPTSSSSSASYRHSHSSVATRQDTATMDDHDSEISEDEAPVPSAPAPAPAHAFFKKSKAQSVSTPTKSKPPSSPFKDQRTRSEIATDSVKSVVWGIVEQLNNKKLTSEDKSCLDVAINAAIAVFHSKKTKSHNQTETKLRALIFKQLTSGQYSALKCLSSITHQGLQSALDVAKDQFQSIFNLNHD